MIQPNVTPNPSANAVAETQPRKPQVPDLKVKTFLDEPSVRKRFEEMLGKRAPAFISSIISAVSSNAALAKCEPMSVVSSAAVAAAMDLPINSSLGFAHIVPYNNVAQFQMGWKGFVQLAMRSGQYKTINAIEVLEGQIKHLNPFTGEMEFVTEATSEKIVGYLLYFKLLNGYEKYFYMTRPDVDAHGKKYSASYKKGFGMWKDDFDAMALKTVVKLGLSKYGILSVDMQQAVALDQAVVGEDGEPRYVDAEVTSTTASAVPSRTEQLNQQAKSEATAAAAQPQVMDADPESFANFNKGNPFTGPKVETMETLQVEAMGYMDGLGMQPETFSKLIFDMFKKDAQDLSLAEVRQVRDRLKADYQKTQVK